MVQTDTHTYILCPIENKLLIIHRKSGAEQTLPLKGVFFEIVIHKDKGFIRDYENSQLLVLDLKSHTWLPFIQLGGLPTCMVIKGDLGYVASSLSVVTIDLITCLIMQTIPLDFDPSMLILFNEIGYIMPNLDLKMKVVHFSLGKVLGSVELEGFSPGMVKHKDKGYMLYDKCLVIYDLASVRQIKRIALKGGTKAFYCYNEKLYWVREYDEAICGFDLATQKTFEIPCEPSPQSISFLGEFGYVRCCRLKHWEPKTVAVIDLVTQQQVGLLENPHNCFVHFADNYVYLGTRKSMLLFNKREEVRKFIKANSLNPSYDDLLLRQEILALLLNQDPLMAWTLLLCLNQPLSFFDSQEGDRLYQHLSPVMQLRID